MSASKIFKLIIGSRESELALKQTSLVKDMLKSSHPHLTFEIISMKTKGDKKLDVPLSKIGGKSLFTKELEDALLDNTVDIVVHSLKDLPTTLPDGLVIGAICAREDPSDAVIMNPKYNDLKSLEDLPDDSVIGTSSLRRIAQLKRRFPKLKFESIRGNLNTRLSKLDKGDQYSAIILAAAGVIRMGWKERISQLLSSDDCMYAVGQGALAIECRENDNETISLLAPLNHCETLYSIAAERAVMMTLEGGCSIPVAVDCQIQDGAMILKGGIWSLDGSEELLETMTICLHQPEDERNGNEELHRCPKVAQICPKVRCGLYTPFVAQKKLERCYKLGVSLAKKLLERGAKKLLDDAKAANLPPPNIPPSRIQTLENGEQIAEHLNKKLKTDKCDISCKLPANIC